MHSIMPRSNFNDCFFVIHNGNMASGRVHEAFITLLSRQIRMHNNRRMFLKKGAVRYI